MQLHSTRTRMTMLMLMVVLALWAFVVPAASASPYYLSANYSGASFFDNFNFYSGPDPTHGYVYYTTQQQAFDWGLVGASDADGVYIGCDSWSISSGSGRASVRIESKATWNEGLFVMSASHMPQGCGTWPAWWLFGPNWPNGGEIDIIEGVNLQDFDQCTLHTSDGCNMHNVPASAFTGHWAGVNYFGQPASDCNVNSKYQTPNSGCGIATNTGTYGAPFNAQGGGFYAMQWNSTLIRVWMWPFASAPRDLTTASATPNPDTWGVPFAFFALAPDTCSPKHFHDLQMVINLTFCGDWAGSVFNDTCAATANGQSCNAFVQNNPASFKQAFWDLNYISVFQSSGSTHKQQQHHK